VHVNLLLGNLPTHLNDAHIYQCLTYAWLYKAKQSDDLSFYNIANDNQSVCRALNYSVKEGRANRERLWSTNGIWSVQNCWIPHQALN
jgi:5-methylcytosine-specific restriction endonuclease McrBC regulatory subunit McrC